MGLLRIIACGVIIGISVLLGALICAFTPVSWMWMFSIIPIDGMIISLIAYEAKKEQAAIDAGELEDDPLWGATFPTTSNHRGPNL